MGETMHNDSQRLADNQHALLLAMHQMALLVSEQGSIEYMNESALRFLGDLRQHNGVRCENDQEIRSRLLAFVKTALEKGDDTATGTGALNGQHLEYNVAPFHGYRGERLFWLILKNRTEEKHYQESLAQVHRTIESILQHKIGELKENERIKKTLATQLENFKHHLAHHPSNGVMVGSSAALHELRELVFQIAKTDSTVLVSGESGTGKELVVNMIHQTSRRKDKPLLKINCTAINDSLLESDLFGYEKGAFTGAHGRKKGKFEVVDGGTIFLDEIGDISPRMQAALLRVLQDGEFIRVGGTTPIKVNVRVIAATNIDLAKAVQDGLFRLDLFYRLSILTIALPPLRERRDDIADLANHFISKYGAAFGKTIEMIDDGVIPKLVQHDWPGNIRELENVMQRAVLMSRDMMLTVDDIVFDNPTTRTAPSCSISSLIDKYTETSLKDIVSHFEKEVILHKLKKLQGNVSEVAGALHIGKTALYDKLKRYDICVKSLR